MFTDLSCNLQELELENNVPDKAHEVDDHI
jgi:hypothetical protein